MVTPPDATSIPASKIPKTPGADLPRIVPRRHAGQWLNGAVALLLFAMVLNSVVRNEASQRAVAGRYYARRSAPPAAHSAAAAARPDDRRTPSVERGDSRGPAIGGDR